MSKAITKGEFVKALADKTGMSRSKMDEILNAVLDGITDELKAGNSIALIGFGKFEVVNRSERAGRNPRTRESIIIPASKAPVFRAGVTLKNAVN